jgi:hypothetical protein
MDDSQVCFLEINVFNKREFVCLEADLELASLEADFV